MDVNKDIYDEFNKFKNLLIKREPFSFVRFNDGELHCIKDKSFFFHEFSLDNEEYIKQLKTAFEYKANNYVVGIPCSCCETNDNFRSYIFKNFNFNYNNTTFANLFCNAMYYKFKSEIIPLFQTFKIVLVSNEKTNIKFFEKFFYLQKWIKVDSKDCWKKTDQIYNNIKQFLETKTETENENLLFLFQAGPCSNVLIHRLHKNFKGHIYIDCGSSLSEYTCLKLTRNYQKMFGWKSLAVCQWDKRFKNPYQISCYSGDYNKIERCFLKIYAFIFNCFCILWNYIVEKHHNINK